MKHSIPVVTEEGKNYFMARSDNMKFLFTRLDAWSLIAVPEGEKMDSFEVRRNEEVVIAGYCYNLYGEHSIFLIQYSEVPNYTPARNNSTPHETLYASDFLLGDMIFSDVNAHDVRARGFVSALSFLETIDAKVYAQQHTLSRHNVAMIVSAQQSFFRRVSTNEDVLGLKTFIVPIGF